MALGTPVSGQFTTDEKPYYEFTSTDTPAEGTTTEYYVYGRGYFVYYTSQKDGEKTTWNYSGSANLIAGNPNVTLLLEKDQTVRFSNVQPVWEGNNYFYSLTIAKQPEAKTITLDTECKTGKLAQGQKTVYTLTHTSDTQGTYTLSYNETNRDVSVNCTTSNGWVSDKQRISMSKDEKLTVTITARNDVDDFAFTVSAFKPVALELGKIYEKVVLKAGEAVYYQYKVAEAAAGDYVLSMVNADGNAVLTEENGVVLDSLRNGVNDLTFAANDEVLFKVLNDNGIEKASFNLTLQKVPAEDAYTDLKVENNAFSLKAGEVKYFKFKVPEEETKKGTRYVLSIPKNEKGGVEYQLSGYGHISDSTDYTNPYLSGDFTIRAANTSVSTKDCSIDLQKRETMTLGTASEKTLVSGDKVYYQYMAAKYSDTESGGMYVLSLAEDTDGVRVCNENNGNYLDYVMEDIYLDENGVLLLTVEASKKTSYKLTLQKKPADAKLPTTDAVTLKPGEVKYFKYEVENAGDYALSIPASSGALKYTIIGDGEVNNKMLTDGYNKVYYGVSDAIEVKVVNTLLIDATCQIDVQKYSYEGLNSGESRTITKDGSPKYYRLSGIESGNYELKCSEKDVSVKYSTDKTATKKWSDVPADGKIALTGTNPEIYLQISYSGEGEKTYTVTFQK